MELPSCFHKNNQQSRLARNGSRERTITKAPVAISGNNIYVTWWTNNTAKGDGEVMFRTSTDGGKTFSDKINLSNNPKSNSVDAEISASGNDVVVSWWEKTKPQASQY